MNTAMTPAVVADDGFTRTLKDCGGGAARRTRKAAEGATSVARRWCWHADTFRHRTVTNQRDTVTPVGGILQVLVGQPFDTIKVVSSRAARIAEYSNEVSHMLKRFVLSISGCKASQLFGWAPRLCTAGRLIALRRLLRMRASLVFTRSVRSGTSIRVAGLRKKGETCTGLLTPQPFPASAPIRLPATAISGPVEHVRTRESCPVMCLPFCAKDARCNEIHKWLPAPGLQVQTGSPGAHHPVYKGPLDLVRRIYSAHGLAGVYKGQVPTIFREFLVNCAGGLRVARFAGDGWSSVFATRPSPRVLKAPEYFSSFFFFFFFGISVCVCVSSAAAAAAAVKGYGVYFASYEHMMQRAMRNEGKRREELEAWKVCGFGAMSGYILW
ncbi:MAG: hypothetical protein BJ554DRAFT_6461 [Olpidium bornovanus]|uniref:Mitochondrial carrier protein n=1 Tax=Olpidium bornovanus TaxID=278681 RepID=A0A8H8DK76_9FUNG|nr:MAG: hypothetical protein BJ554DRAFT_6461 [Olpidium bornovanus]